MKRPCEDSGRRWLSASQGEGPEKKPNCGFGLLASKSQQNKFPLFKGIQFVVLCYGTLRKPIHWTKEGEPSVLNPSPGPSAVITSLRQQVSEVPITISFLQKESWMVREFRRDTVTSLGLQTQVGLAPALSPLPDLRTPSLPVPTVYGN